MQHQSAIRKPEALNPTSGFQRNAPIDFANVFLIETLQGHLAHENLLPSRTLTVGPWLGPYGGPRGVEVSYERGTPCTHHSKTPTREG